MIFRRKCVCAVMFAISILIVTGCTYDDRYDDGYDDGLRNGRLEGYDVGYKAGHEVGYGEGYEASKPPPINQITVNPLPSSDPKVTIQDLFIYENIKMTERSKGRSLEFSGEITNRTGVDFSFAKFEITLYDANRRVIETDTALIFSFEPNSTRSFDEWILVPVEDVKHYSIMFVDG